MILTIVGFIVVFVFIAGLKIYCDDKIGCICSDLRARIEKYKTMSFNLATELGYVQGCDFCGNFVKWVKEPDIGKEKSTFSFDDFKTVRCDYVIPKEYSGITLKPTNDFDSIVDRLISLNKELRKRIKHVRDEITTIAYRKQFCTVKCNIGRRSGKSFYIKERAGKNDIIICMGSQRHCYVGTEAAVMDINQFKNLYCCAGSCLFAVFVKNIFVDEPSFSIGRDMKRFYEVVSRYFDDDITIVMLGE